MIHSLPGFFRSAAFLSILILILSVSSCKTYRHTIKEPLKTLGTEYLIEQMSLNEIKSEYITARFSAEMIRNREKLSFNGQIRIKRDSIIWITISPMLGIEMGRLIVTNDSVKWVNRMESNYLLTELGYLTKMIHPLVDFDLLQSILLGNDLTLYDDSQFRGSIDSREYRLSVMQRNSIKRQLREEDNVTTIPFQTIWLDPETFRITKVLIKDLQDRDYRIDALYERFAELDGHLFATRHQYDILGGGNRLKLAINFSRLATPESTNFPFTVPDKYIPLEN